VLASPRGEQRAVVNADRGLLILSCFGHSNGGVHDSITIVGLVRWSLVVGRSRFIGIPITAHPSANDERLPTNDRLSDTEEHDLSRCDPRHNCHFFGTIATIGASNPHLFTEYRYRSYFFRNSHWVDNLCQCTTSPLIPSQISGFALTGNSREYRRDMSQRLGDLLVKEKVITTEQLEQATKTPEGVAHPLASALVKLGFLSDEDVTNFLSRQYGVPAINLSYFEIDPAVVKLIPFETAKRYQILPLSRVGASLTIAMVDPTNVFAMDDIKFMTGFNIEPVVASESSILAGIDKAYGTSKEEELESVMQSMNDAGEGTDIEVQNEEQELELRELEKAADEAPIVKAREPGAHRRRQARRQRHSHGALRKGISRPLPY